MDIKIMRHKLFMEYSNYIYRPYNILNRWTTEREGEREKTKYSILLTKWSSYDEKTNHLSYFLGK